MELENLNRTLLGFLRTYVSHPDPSYTGEWILMAYPKAPMQSPIMVLQPTGISTFRLEIGSNTLGYIYRYELSVFTDQTTSYTIDNEVFSGTKLLAWIADGVSVAFLNHQDTLRREGILDVKIESLRPAVYDPRLGGFSLTLSLSVLVL